MMQLYIEHMRLQHEVLCCLVKPTKGSSSDWGCSSSLILKNEHSPYLLLPLCCIDVPSDIVGTLRTDYKPFSSRQRGIFPLRPDLIDSRDFNNLIEIEGGGRPFQQFLFWRKKIYPGQDRQVRQSVRRLMRYGALLVPRYHTNTYTNVRVNDSTYLFLAKCWCTGFIRMPAPLQKIYFHAMRVVGQPRRAN